MRLVSLHIENFGRISNFDYVFNDNLNVFRQPNGWGKTTLASFLKAMFFGMDKRGKVKPYSADRTHFFPWQGGIYGGSLIFEINNKMYRILRTFAQTPEGDRFELVDIQTGRVSKDFSSNIGYEIFGVGAETFSMTSYFAQGQLENQINSEVRAFLTGANGLDADIEASDKAVDKLDKTLRNIRAKCPSSSQLVSLDNDLKSLQIEKEEIEEQKEKISSELNEKHSKLVACDGQKFVDTEKIESVAITKKKELGIIQNNYDKQLNKEKIYKILLTLFCCVGCVALTFSILFFNQIVVCSVLATVFLASSIIVICSVFKLRNKNKTNLQDNIQKLNEEIQNVSNLLGMSKDQINNLTEKSNLLKDIAVLNERIKMVDNNLEQVLNKIDELDNQIANLKLLKNDCDEKIRILCFVKENLIKAKQNVSVRFVEPMQKKLVELLSRLSTEKMFLRVDFDMEMKIDTQIGLMEKEFLSQGKQDLLSICKRVALIESVFKKTKPFIVLDDPFVNLDDETMNNMLKLIAELSESYQIIYLTCHSARSKQN